MPAPGIVSLSKKTLGHTIDWRVIKRVMAASTTPAAHAHSPGDEAIWRLEDDLSMMSYIAVSVSPAGYTQVLSEQIFIFQEWTLAPIFKWEFVVEWVLIELNTEDLYQNHISRSAGHMLS